MNIIIKIALIIGLIYFLYKISFHKIFLNIYNNISNKFDIIMKNTEEYNRYRNERKRYLKKFIKSMKNNDEI